MGKWADMAKRLQERDDRQVEDINGFYGGGMTIENRIALADARAVDALAAVVQILKYLDEIDAAAHNAVFSGATEK